MVGPLEGETPPGEVEWRHRRRPPLRMGEGVLDGHLHVRLPDLRLHRAVDELDHGVDDALGVDHDVDSVVADPEEDVRLDHLEALVYQGGRIDGDPPTHRPRWVAESLGRCDLSELVCAPSSEGPRCGQDDPFDGICLLPRQALEHGECSESTGISTLLPWRGRL